MSPENPLRHLLNRAITDHVACLTAFFKENAAAFEHLITSEDPVPLRTLSDEPLGYAVLKEAFAKLGVHVYKDPFVHPKHGYVFSRKELSEDQLALVCNPSV